MEPKTPILPAVQFAGGAILTIGILFLVTGISVSDLSLLLPIGIGTAIGAIFVFLMGVFFVATEEMINKGENGVAVQAIHTHKGVRRPALYLVYSADRKSEK